MTIEQGIFTSEFLEKFGKLTLVEFVEKYVSTLQVEEPQQAIETNEVTVEPTSTEKPAANSEFKELADNVAELISLIKISNHKDEVIDNLHKELMQYKQGLQEAIIAPLLKAIVREYSWISKQYRFYLEKSQEEPQSELFNKLLSEFKMLSFSLLNLLSDYDIEAFDFKTGDARNIKLQKFVEIVETGEEQQDGTVAECVTCGFRNIETTRLFHQAEVKIYKLKK
jgi:molecular chaperone GrpE (heat shock protein)